MRSWYLYVLECSDSSLYTGISPDPERRVEEHNSSPRGSRYTRSRRPVVARVVWLIGDRKTAASAEVAFKRLPRAAKLALLGADRGQLLERLGFDG